MRDGTNHQQTDPLSAASTGLVALGLNWEQRAETLALLAALIDLADNSGEVLLDSALLRVEERLGIDLCLSGYERLEQLAIVHRTWSGWVIRNFETHARPCRQDAATRWTSCVATANCCARSARPSRTRVPAEAATPVVNIGTWRRRAAARPSPASRPAWPPSPGATQIVPQAAVTTRNITNGATVTTVAPAPNRRPTVAPTTVVATGHHRSGLPPRRPARPPTTSTTLLPEVPCVSDILHGKKALLPKAGEPPLGPLLDC